MNKERELLQRVVTAWEDDRYELIDAMVDVVVDIKDYLANPPEHVNVHPFCGVVKMPELYQALKKLSFAARTTGGTAGRDDFLCDAIDTVEAALARLKESHD